MLSCSLLLSAQPLATAQATRTTQAAQTTQAVQSLGAPRREQLLNGLKLFLLNRPSDPEVLLKLRIKSGAAFDLVGKEGVMALLGDALFSDPATREYVTEELGGRLEVSTTYDAIEVTINGHAAQFERMVELLRGALVNTQLSPELVARLREARLKAVRDVSVAPATVADRALATRLFGNFPYGRIIDGSPESLARIERADLLLVRERFLNPNNASLAVVGGVDASRVLRTVRQFLGVWRRSDVEIPATFRQPEAPDARTLLVDFTSLPDAEVRLATRGLARSDKDAATARLLSVLVRERWQRSLPELKGRPFFVEHQSMALPGVFRMGASVPTNLAAQALAAGRAALQYFVANRATAEELEYARREVIASLNAAASQTAGQAAAWLDEESYGTSITDELRAAGSLGADEVQRVASRLFARSPVVAVVVGDAAQLRAELARAGEVEVLGASAAAPATTTTAPAASATPKPAQLPLTVPVMKPPTAPVRRP